MPVITFLGGARTVTGSKYLLDHDGTQVMVDCGLFQGDRKLRDRNWQPIPVGAESAAIGDPHARPSRPLRIPAQAACGRLRGRDPRDPRDHRPGVHHPADSAHLQEEEARFANEHGYSKHQPALPLYDAADVEGTLPLFRPLDHGRAPRGRTGITASLSRAATSWAHPSCASTWVAPPSCSAATSDDRATPSCESRSPSVMPTGSWSRAHTATGRTTTRSRSSKLRDVIARTIASGGTVVIPAFAVDRTEVLLHHLGHLADRGELPQVPGLRGQPHGPRGAPGLPRGDHGSRRPRSGRRSSTTRRRSSRTGSWRSGTSRHPSA